MGRPRRASRLPWMVRDVLPLPLSKPIPMSPVAKCISLALCVVAVSLPGRAGAFSFDDVIAQARTMSGAAQRVVDSELSKELLDLDYDQYRDIRFRPDRAVWRDAKVPFELM